MWYRYSLFRSNLVPNSEISFILTKTSMSSETAYMIYAIITTVFTVRDLNFLKIFMFENFFLFNLKACDTVDYYSTTQTLRSACQAIWRDPEGRQQHSNDSAGTTIHVRVFCSVHHLLAYQHIATRIVWWVLSGFFWVVHETTELLWKGEYGVIQEKYVAIQPYFQTIKTAMYVYMIVAVVWICEFIFACQSFVICGAVSTWYFTR